MSASNAQEWIVIRGMGSVSGLGCTRQEVVAAYQNSAPTFKPFAGLGLDLPVSPISASAERVLQNLLVEVPTYATLDRSVQLAILAARQAVAAAGWADDGVLSEVGINLGSSRGATGLFEQYHSLFLGNESRLSPNVSPTTTLGNLTSWVAQDLQVNGPQISHSVTCSTALQALANGMAWLKSGMAKRFLVGGTEAPLTAFTLAQMKALGIYSPFAAEEQPCRPLLGKGPSTFVLGEGAAVFALERMTRAEITALPDTSVLVLEGVGMGFEQAPSKTGLSTEGMHFQQAMQNALAQANLSPAQIDALVVHAPGTRAGDAAEKLAISTVFGEVKPSLYTNKNLIGHTLGASGALSLETAVLLLTAEMNPLLKLSSSGKNPSVPINRIMLNSAGFGGNAVSIVVSLIVI